MTPALYSLHHGTQPLLISLPHVGSFIPEALRPHFAPRALHAEDTDWFLDRLYAFATDLGASLLAATHSRYVIDLNRPRENTPMYAGQNNTELCPTRFFTGEPLYHDGQAPGVAEVQERVAGCWQPYHDALRGELGRIQARHGHAVLFDGHSIKSELPWLFEGTLPHLNLGTVAGASCAPSLTSNLTAVLAAQASFQYVVDGRFKGGHITRHYGAPTDHVHAVQLEMCWRAYMDETPPYRWQEARAAAVTPLLRRLLQAMIDWPPESATP